RFRQMLQCFRRDWPHSAGKGVAVKGPAFMLVRQQMPSSAGRNALSNVIDIFTDARRFQLLIDAVTDYAIYMIDPKGVVISWNSGAQRFKGYAAEEVLGSNFSRFYTEADRAASLPQRMLQTAEKEGRCEAEGWRVRKDGTRFWASVVVDPIRDKDGNLLGFAKITRDISEKREAQEALEQTRAALFQAQKMEAIG